MDSGIATLDVLKPEELLEYTELLNDKDKTLKLSLFFVMRELKAGVKPNDPVMDKYNFNLVKASLTDELIGHFRGLLATQIEKHSAKDEVEISEYRVIDDDYGDKIYSYALNNALSFSDVVTNKIEDDTKYSVVKSLTDLKSNSGSTTGPKLWAYSLRVENINNSEVFYSFRKIADGKLITSDQNIGDRISALFDINHKELKAFDGNLINFDDKIDCVCIKNRFYVFHKKAFESILGMDEEFLEISKKTLKTIQSSNVIDEHGMGVLDNLITHKPSIRKQLISITEKNNHLDIHIEEVNRVRTEQMKKDPFEIENGKIKFSAENAEADARDFLKIMNDYYKKGLTSGKIYKTDAGSLVDK